MVREDSLEGKESTPRKPSQNTGLGRRGERDVFLAQCRFTPSVFPAKNQEKNAKRRARREKRDRK